MPGKKPYVPPTLPDIQEEIEIFRKEEEAAQQTFFAYLWIRDLLAKRLDVLAAFVHRRGLRPANDVEGNDASCSRGI